MGISPDSSSFNAHNVLVTFGKTKLQLVCGTRTDESAWPWRHNQKNATVGVLAIRYQVSTSCFHPNHARSFDGVYLSAIFAALGVGQLLQDVERLPVGRCSSVGYGHGCTGVCGRST